MAIIYLFSKLNHKVYIYLLRGKTFKEKRELAKQASKRVDAIYYATKMWRNTKKRAVKMQKKKEKDGNTEVLTPNPSDYDNYFRINVNFPVAFVSKMRALNELDNLLFFSVCPRFFQGGLLFKTEQDAERSLNLLKYKNWDILSPIKEVRVKKSYVDEFSAYYKKAGKFYDEGKARLIGI